MRTLEGHEEYADYLSRQWFVARGILEIHYVGRLLPSMKEFVQILFTFLLVLIGWIIFRAENIRQAWDYLSRMCSPSLLDLHLQYGKKALLYTFVLLMVEWLQRDKQHALQIEGTGILKYRGIRWGIYILLALFTLVFAGTQAEFIYFQF